LRWQGAAKKHYPSSDAGGDSRIAGLKKVKEGRILHEKSLCKSFPKGGGRFIIVEKRGRSKKKNTSARAEKKGEKFG